MEGKKFLHAKGEAIFPRSLAKVTGVFFIASYLLYDEGEGLCRAT